MRRTLILTTIGAVALTLGLGVGATLAGSSPISRATNMMTTNGGHMGDIGDMTAMMNGVDTTSMMGTDGMKAMHTAMHDALADSWEHELLDELDETVQLLGR